MIRSKPSVHCRWEQRSLGWADEYPESFLVKIRKCPIIEGSIPDSAIEVPLSANYSDSSSNSSIQPSSKAIPAIPPADRKEKKDRNNHKNDYEDTHPPSPQEVDTAKRIVSAFDSNPPINKLNREELRFLYDIAAHPLSTTVLRYQRINLSRRKGNAIRQSLAAAASY